MSRILFAVGHFAGRHPWRVLAEQHDEWTEGRRYLGLDVLARSRAALVDTTTNTDKEEGLTPNALTA